MCKHIGQGLLAEPGVKPVGAPLIRERARPQMAEMTTELAVNVKGGQVEAEGQSRRGSEEGQSGEEWAEEGYHKQWKAPTRPEIR